MSIKKRVLKWTLNLDVKLFLFFSCSLSVVFILIQFYFSKALNKLGKLAITKIFHIKVVKFVIYTVTEFADTNSFIPALWITSFM